MIALILRNDPVHAAAMSLTLMDIGFQVICVESLAAAEAIAKGSAVDIVVVDERVDMTLTHRLLLSVERRNPSAISLVLTDKRGEGADELFLLMPSIYALLPLDATMPLMARLVHAAMKYAGENAHSIASDIEAGSLLDDMLDDWVEDDVPVIAAPAPVTPHDNLPPLPTGGFQSVRTPVMH